MTTGYVHPEALVGTDWLAEHLNDGDMRVVDASFYLPTEGRDPRAEFAEVHIPGARFFDIDQIADTGNPLPHMFPSAERFGAEVGALGIGNGARVVCYDSGSMMASCRAWWMFRAFGHEQVSVLNGGLRKWRAEGRPVESGVPSPEPVRFEAAFRPGMVRLLDQVRDIVDKGGETIVDVRAAGRFNGSEPEPRPGMRSGHMPGAVSLPYGRILNSDGTFRDAAAIGDAIAGAGLAGTDRIVASCGSGVSAAVLLLGLHLIGHRQLALYDGSWSEWGGRQDTPVVT